MIKLTETVQKGGCAAKIAAVALREILNGVRFPPTNADVLIDGKYFDDAAIYRVGPDLALVQTLDFFTPIVDTPSLFGRVAAANALSDVYAMGGTPKTAMAILAFPLATLPGELAGEVIQGACDILREAETALVGGHSIDDETLKFGLSVTGLINPKHVWSNSGAKVGDRLILTKGLGTGAITAALKRRAVGEPEIADALQSMMKLNRVLDLIDTCSVHAATDITGFGLLGHARQLGDASGVTLNLEIKRIPRLDGAEQFLREGFLTKAHRSNREYVDDRVAWGASDELERQLCCDPQTSGGLLLAVDAKVADQILDQLRARFPAAALIGEVHAPGPHAVVLH